MHQRRRRGPRPWRWLIAVAVVLALLGGAVFLGQRALIYFPDRSVPPPAAEAVPGARDVTLSTHDGLELTAWLVPASEEADTGVAVLYLPGNGATARGAPGPPGCSPSGD